MTVERELKEQTKDLINLYCSACDPVWFEWNPERGPLTNQDYQREIEDRSIEILTNQLEDKRCKRSTKANERLIYRQGGSFTRLEQV